jgi:hypothetical protein
MTKKIVAYRNFANAPKTVSINEGVCRGSTLAVGVIVQRHAEKPVYGTNSYAPQRSVACLQYNTHINVLPNFG